MSAGEVAVLYWFLTSVIAAVSLWHLAKMPNPINRFAAAFIIGCMIGYATWPIWIIMLVKRGRTHHAHR